MSLGRIDQYELIRELGGGGFGCVYLARDTVAGIEVAVKGLPPLVRLNKEELENVRKNFALVSRLHHPNIAAALHLQKVEKAFYDDKSDAEKLRVFGGDTLVVMQYAPGVTLSQWRKQFPDGKVPLDKALEITRQIASALDYAHKEKILHRDIKPANVMIETGVDGSLTARVLDFGLAAEIRSSMSRVSQSITDTSGTRPYMAPEQWLGEKQGFETDQYSLAVLFYELITGEVPFASVFDTGDPVLMMNVVGNRAFNPSSDLPKPIRFALTKALAKKREDRFESCIAFVDALVGCGAVTASSGKAFGKIAAVGLLVLGLVGGIWYWQDSKVKEEARIVAGQKAEAERKAAEEARRIAEEKAKKEKAETERKQKEEEARLAAQKEAERNAELEVFRLSSKVKSAHELIDQESLEIKEFFATEIRAFENNCSSGDEAKEKSKYVITTNFYTQALASAAALKVSGTQYRECKVLFPKIERAKERADEVEASESLPSGYKSAQNAQNTAFAAFNAKDFDECKEKCQEAESLFISLRTDVINAVLDIAEGHKDNERWEKCKDEAEKVLEWDADNAKAKELKNEALRHLVLSLKVIATIDGEEVRGAKLNDGQKDYILPTIFKLKQGKKYGPYKIVYEHGGKSYKGTFDAVTVNWLGLKTLTVALKEYTGPRHGDRKTLRLPGGETMTMIYVAPGSFMMGSPTTEKGRDDHETQHHVTLTKGYWLGETEVTQAQWESVMGNNPSFFKGASRPVEKVSWEDCQEFIAKVNREARRQFGGDARLPTEAEWEYACRAGSRAAYSWGNSLNGDKANCNGNYPYGTTIKGPYKQVTENVCSYSPNAWGFYDMHGNVWEWCQDWYGAYPSGAVTDPTGQASGDDRVLRGGSWYFNARCCRSANRDRDGPGNRFNICGFRLACSVELQKKMDSAPREDARPTISQSASKVQLWEDGPYWATMNIGAEKPEDSGYYFWWGDTVGYKREGDKWGASDGSMSNFLFSGDNTPTYIKSISALESGGWIEKKDGTDVLTSNHDAARAHWKGEWRMPTKDEFDDLVSMCDWKWTMRNGKNGYVVRGRGNYASKSIFLPCAGYGYGTSLYDAGSRGNYWSSGPNSNYYDDAWYLYFNSSNHNTYYGGRSNGRTVRPVQGFTK